MKTQLFIRLIGCILCVACGMQRATADTQVYVNASIYTVNDSQPWAEAVAVKDGVIIAVGNEEEVLAVSGETFELIDLNGLLMLPGFQDPHLHALEAGLFEDICYFPPYRSLSSYARLARQCAQSHPDSEWVVGVGVAMDGLIGGSQIPVSVLDEAVPDRPVLVIDNLGHGAWANSAALKQVQYDEMVVDPAGGILGQTADGDLNGLVYENAQQRLREAAFPPNASNLDIAYRGLLDAMDRLAKYGITSVSDAGGFWLQGHHRVWQRAESEGMLTVRASNALYVYPDIPWQQQIDFFSQTWSDDPDRLLRFNQAKIYIDGIFDNFTAALYEPYRKVDSNVVQSDDGFLYFELDILQEVTVELEEMGYQFHFHVVGDRATGIALDAIEQTQRINQSTDNRHRLSHVYLVDVQDLDRFNELDVVADLQLAPSAVDGEYAEFLYSYLGNRATRLSPLDQLLHHDATITLSSDWDADVLSPFIKIETVLKRHGQDGLDIDTIIRMMTINSAWLLHQEKTTGSIEVGKWADLIVLDQNLFTIPANKISQTKVLFTLLGGEIIFQH